MSNNTAERTTFPFAETIKDIRHVETYLLPKELISATGISGAHWGVIKSNAIGKDGDTYDRTFAPLGRIFQRNVIERFLKERQQAGLDTVYLDLAGGEGEGARQLKRLGFVRRSVTENLTDIRDGDEKAFDLANGLSYVPGNLFRRATWNGIDRQLHDIDPSAKADLITMRGRMAYSWKHPREAYASLLIRALDRLNPNGGTLFTDVPTSVVSEGLFVDKKSERELKAFLESLKERYPNMTYKFVHDYHDFKTVDPPMIPFKWFAGVLRIDFRNQEMSNS